MTAVFIILFLIGVVLGVLRASDISIDGSVHKKMIRDHAQPYGKGTAEDFWREWNKRSFKPSPQWENGWWTEDHRSQFFASIIKFDGRGMMLDTMDFIRVERELMRRWKAVYPEVSWNLEKEQQ